MSVSEEIDRALLQALACREDLKHGEQTCVGRRMTPSIGYRGLCRRSGETGTRVKPYIPSLGAPPVTRRLGNLHNLPHTSIDGQ